MRSRSPPGGDSPERALEQQQLRALVRSTIADTYRVALILRDSEGLSTSEAALALDITENAVRLRLHRARQALTTLLQ